FPYTTLFRSQDRNFLGALTQGRDADLDDIEAVVKILAEASFCHGTLKVLVGRREDPNVDLQRRLAADAGEIAVLEHVEELGLEGGVQVADLVEEDRAVMGRLEFPDLELVGPGERAPLVAKQLALQQLARDGRAVHLDEGTRAACR